MTTSTSHAVSRTSEFLSCAKTALKIAQQQPAEGWWSQMGDPSQLTLHTTNSTKSNSPLLATLFEDGCTLLRTMDASLETLQGLVRRRGHTNDPTPEIAVTTQQLEADMQELKTVIAQLQSFPSTGKQQKKHLEWVSKWLQTVASQHSSRLKEILKVRGTVLADQAQRRKRFQATTAKAASKKSSSSGTSASLQVSSTPLFTATTPQARKSAATPTNNGHGRRIATSTPTYYGNNSNQTSHNAYYSNGSNTATPTATSGGYGGGSNGYGGGLEEIVVVLPTVDIINQRPTWVCDNEREVSNHKIV